MTKASTKSGKDDTNNVADEETPVSDPKVVKAQAEEEAANAKKAEKRAKEKKAGMMALPYMKPDYSGPISSQIVEARRRFKAEFAESPWEDEVKTK